MNFSSFQKCFLPFIRSGECTQIQIIHLWMEIQRRNISTGMRNLVDPLNARYLLNDMEGWMVNAKRMESIIPPQHP